MGITRRATEPTGVTNTSGQPEIVLEIDGLTIQMTPPSAIPPDRSAQPYAGESDEADEG